MTNDQLIKANSIANRLKRLNEALDGMGRRNDELSSDITHYDGYLSKGTIDRISNLIALDMNAHIKQLKEEFAAL